jgi:hypothetical protein
LIDLLVILGEIEGRINVRPESSVIPGTWERRFLSLSGYLKSGGETVELIKEFRAHLLNCINIWSSFSLGSAHFLQKPTILKMEPLFIDPFGKWYSAELFNVPRILKVGINCKRQKRWHERYVPT